LPESGARRQTRGPAALAAKGRKRETIRKAVSALAQVLDFVGVQPNPARDKVQVRLPRGDSEEPNPPTGDHLEAVYRLLPARYRLPLLVLDATGMRLGELEQLAWGDVDEQRGRWRVTQAVSKTSRARWVQVPPPLFQAVTELVPREDRIPERRVFQGFGGDVSGPRSRERARPPACLSSRRTTSVTDGSACST
jgi:integrase